MEQNSNQITNYPQLQEALDGIRKAVQGEREDELFYDYLISEAPNVDEKKIISSIRDDERRHNRLFRLIYEDFTGEQIPAGGEETFEKPVSYLDGIRRALFGELGAVERYRAIRRRLPRGQYRDVLFDIITDELRHASMYNYLFTLNSTKGNSNMDENLLGQNMISATDTSKYTPDDWVKYIEPLVDRALAESKEGINPKHLYQEFIVAGVLVGLGKNPQEAIEQVED